MLRLTRCWHDPPALNLQIKEKIMAHWLIKSEPVKWSWAQQVAAGQDGTFWNGVRNHLAKQHLMAMRLGETAPVSFLPMTA